MEIGMIKQALKKPGESKKGLAEALGRLPSAVTGRQSSRAGPRRYREGARPMIKRKSPEARELKMEGHPTKWCVVVPWRGLKQHRPVRQGPDPRRPLRHQTRGRRRDHQGQGRVRLATA
jgi:hypothetical protein